MDKLLVYGLDGATFTVLLPYIRRNPNGLFARWLREGHARTLLSTLPYFTAPGWSTFMTGLGPGQHGLYHWRARYDRELETRPLISSAHVSEASFWWYCQHQGARVSVSNFPMQYPAPPTDGRYICGTLAPEAAQGVTWPPQLIKNIRDAFPAFRFEMSKGLSYVNNPVELKSHILEVGKNHFDVLRQFGASERVDLLVHIVTITDRMQHFFWHCFDDQHPDYVDAPRVTVGNPIFDAYRAAEEVLEELWNQGCWDNAIIVSDHGMGPSTTSFHTDCWLASKGLAVFREGKVDFASSLAYSGEEPECSIYINRKGRDGWGVDDDDYPVFAARLREDLERVVLPGTQCPVFRQVCTQGMAFAGRFADLGPDLVLVPADGVHPRPGHHDRIFDHDTRLMAGHRREGVFIGYGKDFAPSPLAPGQDPMHIQDVFPLMAALMGLRIPSGLPGRIPHDIVTRLTRIPTYDAGSNWEKQVGGPVVYQESSQDLLARMAELGYI